MTKFKKVVLCVCGGLVAVSAFSKMFGDHEAEERAAKIAAETRLSEAKAKCAEKGVIVKYRWSNDLNQCVGKKHIIKGMSKEDLLWSFEKFILVNTKQVGKAELLTFDGGTIKQVWIDANGKVLGWVEG